MRAMILAAGRGERLRPLTERMPKPMIPIAGAPLIVHQLRWLRRAGIEEVVVNLHHLGDQLESHVGSGRDLGVRVHYSREETLLGTGGGVKRALPLLDGGPFLVLNGDIWTNFPFRTLLGAAPTTAHLVLTACPPHRTHADFALADGRLRRHGGEGDDLVFCGIAVLDPGIFDDTPDGPFDLARDIYFDAAHAGRLTGELFEGTWFDIGSPDQLRAVRRLTD
ncbi:MAG: nucleotidyltransferase family protein [Gammaproteobacteria bacterium]|nr:nucleotidyltransferase family protein [Gammaproteobacteria bacterium]MYE81318.1 nucleotidyltransferase family protein [Gammaproteobacteria bacterium]